MKQSLTLALVEEADGEIGVHVATALPLENLDHEFQSALSGSATHFQVCASSSRAIGGWAHIDVCATAPGRWAHIDRSVKRFLDLRSGGEERRLFEALSQQNRVCVTWVNENAAAPYTISSENQAIWRQVLENTRELSPEEWRREYDWLLAYGHRATELPFHRRRAPRHVRRAAAPPTRPAPFFAARSGAVPRAGRPTVAGVKLPSGERNPDYTQAYWVSEEPIGEAGRVAARLAEAFSETGVWPLLWDYDEDPADYMTETGDVLAIDALDVEDLLRTRWEGLAGHSHNAAAVVPFDGRFPGLASGNPGAPGVVDPFQLGGLTDASARLLLVPCNRPADAITVLGGLARETDEAEISAVVRSWEERFGATLVAVEPGLATVAVLSPPESTDDALLLAAEYWAFCPPPEGATTETVKRLAAAMIGGGNPADPLGIDRQGAVWLVAPP